MCLVRGRGDGSRRWVPATCVRDLDWSPGFNTSPSAAVDIWDSDWEFFPVCVWQIIVQNLNRLKDPHGQYRVVVKNPHAGNNTFGFRFPALSPWPTHLIFLLQFLKNETSLFTWTPSPLYPGKVSPLPTPSTVGLLLCCDGPVLSISNPFSPCF